MTRLVQAELLKLRTTRTARTLLALAAAGTAALVALVLLLAGRPGQPELGEEALRQLVLVPARPLTLAALVLGILGMAGELRHGTATSTFLVTPVRGRVVAAKLAAAAGTGLAMALVASAAVFAVALPWLRRRGSRWPSPTPGCWRGWPGWPWRSRCSRCSGSGSPRCSATRSRPWSSGCCGGRRASRASSSACCASPAWNAGCPRAPPRR
jgi:ABC-2 type transport system permease protein